MNGVTDPMTPEQSKAQVIDAAKDVSRAVAQPVASANFSHSGCSDGGEPPFHGVVNIFYAAPTDPAAASAAFDEIAQRLQAAGWAADGDFKTHGSALRKNNVDAVLYRASVDVPKINVVLSGECRDMTTTKAQAGIIEKITLP
jgi:hypothetical protein